VSSTRAIDFNLVVTLPLTDDDGQSRIAVLFTWTIPFSIVRFSSHTANALSCYEPASVVPLRLIVITLRLVVNVMPMTFCGDKVCITFRS